MRAWTTAAASASSRGRMRGVRSNTVTALPKRANACASSQPMGPAPMTASRRGSSVREKTVSLVRKPASSSPATGGAAGRAPVQTTARAKRNAAAPTRTVSRPAKRPSPRKTSTPRLLYRAAESTRLIFARSRRMRAMAAPKSRSTPPGNVRPNSAPSRADAQTRAARRIPFDGTQPTLRQSPPIRPRSTSATRAPSPAATTAVTSPAVPAPITTRL